MINIRSHRGTDFYRLFTTNHVMNKQNVSCMFVENEIKISTEWMYQNVRTKERNPQDIVWIYTEVFLYIINSIIIKHRYYYFVILYLEATEQRSINGTPTQAKLALLSVLPIQLKLW